MGAPSSSDHERTAVAAYLTGQDEACEQAWEAAYRVALDADDVAESARCAFWLALCLMMRGRMAQAGGWLGRAESLLADAEIECAASGYLLIPQVLGALDGGDPATARDLAVRATELGKRFDDADLRAFGTLGHGQALIAMGDTVAGTARLDDVMVSVASGEVGPMTSGIVYCAVILECMAMFDLPRAAEWTDALSAWCDAQPGLVPYRGQCLVHRSQLQQASGQWSDAIATIEAACARLSDPPHPALGLAHYQQAELHRLVGDFDRADAAYREASRHGQDPMPGLALLELGRGDVPAAAAAIRRALQETQESAQRLALLAAAVDILRAAGDLAGARAAAEELTARASASASIALGAMAAYATGAVLVDDGDAPGALTRLRDAARAWQSLRMPYEHARTAQLLARACAALGDHTAAELELANARDTFAELGAKLELERLDASPVAPPGAVAGGLSEREREVLIHLAAGRTNREIADILVISQHTVRRHVENIFAKLGVTTRAAATAYAYEHGLLA
jgi:ATP/maltotriose-dependent transcriptional regulator MalT